MRTVNIFGAAILALSTSAWSLGAAAQTPAPDAAAPPADSSTPAPADSSAKPAKKPAHKMHKAYAGKGKLAPTKAGDKAVEDLNDASLAAAKGDKPFTPPPTPEAAKKEAHYGDKTAKPKHAYHKPAKKTAPKTDAAAPAPDATPPAAPGK